MLEKGMQARLIRSFAVPVVLVFNIAFSLAQTDPSVPTYTIYAGNLHSHSKYTWSHGEQFIKAKASKGANRKSAKGAKDGSASDKTLKADWQKHQGPPSAHYALAKANGYDFYAVTDHSQEEAFHPTSPTNPAWLASQQQAAEASDSQFVAIAGYEHSENNGPHGTGHINVFNSAEYLNALEPGIDLPHFYQWLKKAKANGEGVVVASFNHPGEHQYDDWNYCDPEVADIITLLEVINSNKNIHYQAFLNALDKGWKVSPVCGNDNHGFWGITRHASRTFVLATSKTKAAILDAMKNRRTYASVNENLQCRYTVNGQIMGSTLPRKDVFEFTISVSDPDIDKPDDKITKIDIVKDGGEVVQTYSPTPAYSVTWNPTIKDPANKYFFVRVWNAGSGEADDAKPVAWLAPVWTGR